MGVLEFAIRWTDPAGAYLRKQGIRFFVKGDEDRSPDVSWSPLTSTSTVDVPIKPTASEQQAVRDHAEARRRQRTVGPPAEADDWTARCAREISRESSSIVVGGPIEVHGRLIRFWRGDHVLEVSVSRRDGAGVRRSRTRIHRSGDLEKTILEALRREARGVPGETGG
jgi:hypothetical protein